MSNAKQANKGAAKEAVIAWTANAWSDYEYWLKHDVAKVHAINALLKDCKRDPFKGLGKPEGLKGDLTGYWSRRIDKEHRLVYLFEKNCIYVVQCRHHY